MMQIELELYDRPDALLASALAADKQFYSLLDSLSRSGSWDPG